MLSLIEFDDLNFLELNPNYIKKVYDNRYKDTNYSILKIGSSWVIFVIKEDLPLLGEWEEDV